MQTAVIQMILGLSRVIRDENVYPQRKTKPDRNCQTMRKKINCKDGYESREVSHIRTSPQDFERK